MSMVMFKQTKSDHSCYQRDQWITLYTICVLNLTQQDKTFFQRQHTIHHAAGRGLRFYLTLLLTAIGDESTWVLKRGVFKIRSFFAAEIEFLIKWFDDNYSNDLETWVRIFWNHIQGLFIMWRDTACITGHGICKSSLNWKP